MSLFHGAIMPPRTERLRWPFSEGIWCKAPSRYVILVGEVLKSPLTKFVKPLRLQKLKGIVLYT